MSRMFLKVLIVFGVLAALGSVTVTGRAMMKQAGQMVDSQKPVGMVIAEAEAELEANRQMLRRSMGEFRHLENKLAALRRQREARAQQRERDRKTLAFVRSQMAKTGQFITVSTGLTVSRDDVARDAETYLEACRNHDAAIQQFDTAIATLQSQMAEAKRAIEQAKAQLREDAQTLRSLQMRATTARLQERIAQLVDRATPRDILEQSRRFEQRVELAEAKLDAMSFPRPAGSAAPWEKLAHGEPLTSGEELVAEIDHYLEGEVAQR